MAGPTDTTPGGSTETRARGVAAEVRGEADRLTRDTAKAGRDVLERQRGYLAEEVDGIASALRRTARQFHDQQQDSFARYTERAADKLVDFSHDMRERDLGDLVRNVNDFARRQPGIFLGGAVATGFVLSRFLKSSRSENRGEASGEASGEERAAYPYTTSDIEEPSLVHPTEAESPISGEPVP